MMLFWSFQPEASSTINLVSGFLGLGIQHTHLLIMFLRSDPPMIDRKLLYKFGGNFIAKNKLNRQNFANQNHHKSCCGTKSCDET